MRRAASEPAVCQGGPWDGWAYTDDELTTRAAAYRATGHGQPFAYVRTSRFGTLPPAKPKGEPITARVWEHRP